MSPPKAPLDSLATEDLLAICEFLYDDGFIGSLAAFSLANKKCRSAASAVLARTVKFVVDGLDKYPGYLEQDVTQCYRSLERDNNFAHVRRLVVAGVVTPPDWVHPEAATSTRSKGDGWKPRITAAEMVDDEARIEGWLQEGRERHNGTEFAWGEYTIAKVPNGFWEPLAKLIKKLPRLTDLLYACPNQFPPCMLDALHDYHPSCRLHLRNFHLFSIIDRHGRRAVPSAEETAHELRLASSPCLHSVRYSYAHPYGDYEHFNDNEEPNWNNVHSSAVIRCLTRMAPNLKRVHLRPVPDGSTQSFPADPWEAVRQLSLPKSLASLTSIEMDEGFHVSDEIIQLWREFTDMSVLRVLKLKMLRVGGLQELAKCSFPSLVHLDIGLPYVNRRSYWQVVADALRGWTWQRTIRGSLKKDVLELAERSPLLECLALRILRRKGNASEVASYRALGKLKRLRHLRITLVVRPSRISLATLEFMGVAAEHGYGPFEREIWEVVGNDDPRTHLHNRGLGTRALKTAVINSAVDADLVRSIAHVISAAKQRSAAVGLECLKIDVTGYDQIKMCNGDEIDTPFAESFSLLGLPWIARRQANSENGAAYSVVPGWDNKDKYRHDKPPIEEIGGFFLHIFKLVWPRGVWHSFPLETDSTIDTFP